MTSREKALELVDRFLDTENSYKETCDRHQSRECALVAVDEILKEYAVLQIETSFCYQKYLYWADVKQEIEKL